MLVHEAKSQRVIDAAYPYQKEVFLKIGVGDSSAVGWGHIDRLANSFAVVGRTKGRQFTMEVCKDGLIKVTRLK